MKNRIIALSFMLVLAIPAISSGAASAPRSLQATAAPTEAGPTPVALPAITKQFKIAVVAPSAKNDLAWTESMYDSLIAVQKEAGGEAKIKVTISENLFKVPDAATALRDYATQGYDLIIAHGTQYGDVMFEVAKDFPTISFAWGTSSDTGDSKGLKNVFAYEARAEEGGYLFGSVAAWISKSHVLGIVGPVNAGDAKLYIDGFTAGAMAADPTVKVPTIFTQNFGDIPLATQAAKTLLSQGADVLTGSAQQVPGAITETQKAKKIWFSTDINQATKWPDTVAAAMVYDWANSLKSMIGNHLAGTLGGVYYPISLKSGDLKIVWNPKVAIPADVLTKAQDLTAKIESGEVIPPDSPLAATPAATMAATP